MSVCIEVCVLVFTVSIHLCKYKGRSACVCVPTRILRSSHSHAGRQWAEGQGFSLTFPSQRSARCQCAGHWAFHCSRVGLKRWRSCRVYLAPLLLLKMCWVGTLHERAMRQRDRAIGPGLHRYDRNLLHWAFSICLENILLRLHNA